MDTMEAVDILMDIGLESSASKKQAEAIAEAIIALSVQSEKKTVYNNGSGILGKKPVGWYCPTCMAPIGGFCTNCGQKLIWDAKKEERGD